MATRSFEFADGKSDKFWTIALDGRQFTVQFGRRGTSGQTQAKDFPTPAEAQRACDKLIAEKLKKGYAEVGAAARPPAPPPAAVPRAKAPEPAPPAVVPPAKTPEPAPPPPAPKVPEIARAIHLAPADWMLATWRPRQPLGRPPARVFDREAAMELFQRRVEIVINNPEWSKIWNKFDLPAQMPVEEARFWFHAILGLMTVMYSRPTNLWDPAARHRHLRAQADEALARVQKLDFASHLPLEDAAQLIQQGKPAFLLLIPLLNLYPLAESADTIAELLCRTDWSNLGRDSLHDHVFPYLTNEDRDLLRDAIRRRLAANNPPGTIKGRRSPAPDLFHIAGLLGGGEELTRIVEAWPGGSHQSFAWTHWPQDIIFGLPSADLVSHHMRRLKYQLRTPQHIRAWIAHTELRELDLVQESIAATGSRDEAGDMLAAFMQSVTAPEGAPVMLALALESRAPQRARQWLMEHPVETISGIAPVAGGKGKLAEAAIEVLRDLDRAGHASSIEAQLSGTVYQKVAAYKASATGESQPALDDSTTPAGLGAAFAEAAKIKAKAPVWAMASLLPPIVTASGRLNDNQIDAVIRALIKSELALPHPLLLALRCYCTPASLDPFAWALFERWLADGAPAKEKWALAAVGFYGGDQSAMSLAGLIRVWPGQGKHQTAVMGLGCLRAIGTDTALIQISGISQRVKFQAIKARAKECMEEIAADLNLTRPQLEDRVVPDCGLDENGTRVFDFGPRQFRLILGPALKPLVVDGDNQRKPDLPKPNSKDDAAKSEEAVAEWKLLKKQLAEVVKVQTRRLEQALVTQRRWPVAEFESLFLRHPFLMHMATCFVWGAFGRDGKPGLTFRITEDRCFGGEQDSPVTLPTDVTIGLVHPMQLSEASLAAWGELFSDYEILPPFPQLGRPVLRLTDQEAGGTVIDRHGDASIPAASLVGTLERLGWQRAAVADGGAYEHHGKEFPEAGVTAILEHELIFIGMLAESDPTPVKACYFIPGGFDRSGWDHQRKQMPLSKIDPLIVSEVLSDLQTVASKGTA